MASYHHNTSSNKPEPWPAYFIVRTSGEVVPLIGVDELPLGTNLVGVPRALDLEDTIGMLNLGIQRSSEAFYQIEKQEVKKDAVEAAGKIAALAQDTNAKAPSPPTQPSALRSTTAPIPSSTYGYQNVRVTPSGPTRTLQEIQTCRHWCTYGICKWGQQCRYSHIMPMTLSGLQEIGLQDWPHWYRALNPGYFASEATQMRPKFGHRSGAKGKSARVYAGNGCCGGLHLAGGVSHARAEKLRDAGRERREDKGKATLARLTGLAKEETKVLEKEVSGRVLLERAAAKDTRKWEEGSEVSEDRKEGNEGRKGSVAKTSLLD